jgi:hypothetical protein
LAYKGYLEYNTDARTLTLRRPSERLINMARDLHRQIHAGETIDTAKDRTDE